MTGKTEVDPLTAYLDYYKNLVNPGYAVLVTGEWGSGKTFQVKHALESDNPVYVSLFGIESAEKVYLEVLSKSNPDAARSIKFKSAAQGKTAGLSILGFGVTLPIGDMATALIDSNVRRKIDSSRIIVLDDLERSSLDPKALLGIINFYVEHCECRVVGIADDEKMFDEFDKVKEKIIGQTIRVRPKVDEVFDLMVKTFFEDDAEFLRNHSETIKKFFLISTCQSLRVLKRTLDDLVRFRTLFDLAQIEIAERFDPLFRLFLPLDIDVRSGALARTDLVNRYGKSLRNITQKMNASGSQDLAKEEANKFLVSYKKYEALTDLSSSLLADEHLVSMIADGIYDRNSIQEHLSSISYFAEPNDQPAWYNFMNFRYLPDLIVEQAANRMDAQFKDRETSSIGEFLHLVSLRFMRAKNGLLQETQEETVSRSKSYLDDLVTSDRFPISVDEELFRTHPAYGGYGFWIEDDYQGKFKEILDYLPGCRDRGNKLRANQFKSTLLDALRRGPEEFNRQINYSKDQRAVFEDVPVLSCIPPEEFVEAFLKIPVANWRQIMVALKSRRDAYASHESFFVEQVWFRQLNVEMIAAAGRAENQISALRIRKYLLTP